MERRPFSDRSRSSPSPPSAGAAAAVDQQQHPALRISSKVASCLACRKAKAKCRRGRRSGPPFPCSRCLKHNLPCGDPRTDPQLRNGESLILDISQELLKRVESMALDPQHADRLLDLFTVLHKREAGKHGGLEGAFSKTAVGKSPVGRFVHAFCARMGLDTAAYVAQIQSRCLAGDGAAEGQGEGSVVIEGRTYTHTGGQSSAVHPYLSSLLDELNSSTLAVVSIHGRDAFYCNDSFAATFFPQHEASRLHEEEGFPIPVVLALPVQASQRQQLIRRLLMAPLDSPPCIEMRQICKVQPLKLGNVSVMALVRMRLVILAGGSYVAGAISYSPLPMHAELSKRLPQNTKRTTLSCPLGADIWKETAEEFGEWAAEGEEEKGGGGEGAATVPMDEEEEEENEQVEPDTEPVQDMQHQQQQCQQQQCQQPTATIMDGGEPAGGMSIENSSSYGTMAGGPPPVMMEATSLPQPAYVGQPWGTTTMMAGGTSPPVAQEHHGHHHYYYYYHQHQHQQPGGGGYSEEDAVVVKEQVVQIHMPQPVVPGSYVAASSSSSSSSYCSPGGDDMDLLPDDLVLLHHLLGSNDQPPPPPRPMAGGWAVHGGT